MFVSLNGLVIDCGLFYEVCELCTIGSTGSWLLFLDFCIVSLLFALALSVQSVMFVWYCLLFRMLRKMFSPAFCFSHWWCYVRHSVEKIPNQEGARMAWGGNCDSLNDFLLHFYWIISENFRYSGRVGLVTYSDVRAVCVLCNVAIQIHSVAHFMLAPEPCLMFHPYSFVACM